METYHKIQSVFYRDPETKHKTFLEGKFTCPEFEYLRACDWTWTEKVDGINVRVGYTPGSELEIGGRTDRAQFSLNHINCIKAAFQKLIDDPNFISSPMTFYGEGYGAGIQKCGGNYRRDKSFVLFDIRCGDYWLNRGTVEEIGISIGLDVVPVIGNGTLQEALELTRKGFNSCWGDFKAEGIVLRPTVELQGRDGKRIITKIKCKDFQ